MFTEETPPKQHDYVLAINTIREELTDNSIEVLRYQFQSPGRSVSSHDIKDHFGFDGIGGANLLYGHLGKRVAEVLPMQTEPLGASRPHYWKALSTADGTGDCQMWSMRPELANALIETGLVDPSSDGIALVPDVDIHNSPVSVVEGRRRLVLHLVRERNRAIVEAKKRSVTSLACEVCGFDSGVTYGVDYCEIHHLTPLSELKDETETKLEGLAIVCANCHRVVHLKSPPMELEELRSTIERLKAH